MATSHIFFGNQRSGKTLWLAYLANSQAYDKNKLGMCHSKVDYLNSIGFNLCKPKHLTFTDFDLEIHSYRKPAQMNYWIDGFYLGLPHHVVKNKKLTYRTMFLPPYINIYLDEGNKYFDSRNKEIMPDFRKRWIELLGQWGTELYMVCHRPMLVDLCIRDLSDFREFLSTDLTYDYFGNIATATIHTRYYPTNKDVMAYLEAGVLTKNVKIEDLFIDCKQICNNIPKYYDTHFFDKAFLRFNEERDFDLIQKKHSCNSIAEIQDFNKRFNYSVPQGLYEKGIEENR